MSVEKTWDSSAYGEAATGPEENSCSRTSLQAVRRSTSIRVKALNVGTLCGASIEGRRRLVSACLTRMSPCALRGRLRKSDALGLRGTAVEGRSLMRQQYHSRKVADRNMIWDVHRLVELTRHFPVKEVPLSSISELDESFWFDQTPATCREVALHARLIAQTDLVRPIILSAEGRVMDGMHRVCKALLENRSTIAAVQFDQNPEPDYIDADIDALPYDDEPPAHSAVREDLHGAHEAHRD
jgi:hypothetical protein